VQGNKFIQEGTRPGNKLEASRKQHKNMQALESQNIYTPHHPHKRRRSSLYLQHFEPS